MAIRLLNEESKLDELPYMIEEPYAYSMRGSGRLCAPEVGVLVIFKFMGCKAPCRNAEREVGIHNCLSSYMKSPYIK